MTRDDPLILIVGPEGGFADLEREALCRAGATPVRLGPHILRIETAAIACAVLSVAALAGPTTPASFARPPISTSRLTSPR